jgi:hypothetical protein
MKAKLSNIGMSIGITLIVMGAIATVILAGVYAPEGSELRKLVDAVTKAAYYTAYNHKLPAATEQPQLPEPITAMQTEEYALALRVAQALDAEVDVTTCGNTEYKILLPADSAGIMCFNPWGLRLNNPVKWSDSPVPAKYTLFYFPRSGEVVYFLFTAQEGQDYWDSVDEATKIAITKEVNPESNSVVSTAITDQQYQNLILFIEDWSK